MCHLLANDNVVYHPRTSRGQSCYWSRTCFNNLTSVGGKSDTYRQLVFGWERDEGKGSEESHYSKVMDEITSTKFSKGLNKFINRFKQQSKQI